MLNKIIAFSLRNRTLVVILSGVLAILGVILTLRTEVDIFPDLNAPTVVVMTEARGFTPEEVERQITYPLETSVNGAPGVRRVRSQSSAGFSVVWVEFDWDTDPYRARQIVQEQISTVNDILPPGSGIPTLGPQSSILGEMMIIGLTSDSLSLADLRSFADYELRPRLLSLGGVASVSVIGGDEARYSIDLDPMKMRHYGVTLDDALTAATDINRNASGGAIYDFGNEYLVKGDFNTRSLDDIAKTPVGPTGNTSIADIAAVGPSVRTPRLGAASVDARQAVLVTVTKQPATGTLELTDRIDDEIAGLGKSRPEIQFLTDIFRQADFIDTSIANLKSSLLEGALMVIIVLFFFLMNLRVTMVSLVALPMSILLSVIILHFLGFTINTMSLGGIAIAIGSLVDDAIVDVENVHRRLREDGGLTPPRDVVYKASAEVRMPIFNSSLIIVAAFLPLFFLSGIEGRMLIPLGVSFVVALAASTVVALTLTPALCSFLLGRGKDPSGNDLDRESFIARRLKSAYAKALDATLRHRKAVIGTTAALFAIAIGLFFTLGRSFLPPFNEGSLTINVATLPGVSLDESDRIGREAERIIHEMPEITRTARKTGRAELDEHSLGVNVSEIEAPYRLDRRSREELVADLRHRLGELPGVNVEIGQPISHRIDAMLSGTSAQIAVKLFGGDLDRLYSTAGEIKRVMEGVDGIVDVTVEQQVNRPQIDLRPRRDIMRLYGVTPGALSRAVETAFSGVEVGRIYEPDGTFRSIVVRMSPEKTGSLDAIGNLLVDTNRGPVPLTELVEVVSTSGPDVVRRENVSRRIVVSANISHADMRSAVDEIRDRIDSEIDLPAGYYVQYGGQFESEESASRTLAWTTGIALLVVMMLLYNEFRSWRQSLIILVNMPLAAIGGVLILRLTSGQLNIPAIIGFISLLGIATRNGMLLMSRYNALEAEGLPLAQRVRRGSVDRLNPIIMTALTSALALIPLALRGGEPGNEIQSPLAVVILGGLISSTILNVFIVPIFYSMTTRKSSMPAKATGLLLLLLLPAAGHAQTSAADMPSPFDRAVDMIVDADPRLRAAEAENQASVLEANADNNLPDPELSGNYEWGQKGVGDKWSVGISQSFDWPGKYSANSNAARLQAEALRRQQALRRRDAQVRTAQLLVDYIALKRQHEVAHEMHNRMEELEQRYADAFRGGEATVIDLNKAKLEHLTAKNRCFVLANRLDAARAELEALADTLPDLEALDYPMVRIPDIEELESIIERWNPSEALVSAADAAVTAARRGSLPGFTLGYAHNYEIGDHFNELQIGMTLPLFSNRHKTAAALQRRTQAQADAETYAISQRAAMRAARTQANQLSALLRDQREVALDPRPAELLKKALDGGEISLLDYLQEINYFLEARLSYESDLGEFYRTAVTLR